MPDGPSKRQVQVRIENYFNRPGPTSIDQRKVGRPPLPESKQEEVKARIEPCKNKEILAFCAGRRITRSDYLRGLFALDTDYFDHIAALNDPDIKEMIFHVLRIAKKYDLYVAQVRPACGTVVPQK